ncbi:EthD domain-containing protein [Mycobacterium sp. AT1]|uniref:EthD domain-containing protein n=1 Tax=Mycobacterium sp. AT1 TaxID=1961706 RepID=UPI0009C6536A|nr:EthD domain-containing protein [Mycobacterium sp. AT1]OPX13333.1 hypothetical protein B1790_00855 [Mycobacterium sp. AT1]
MIKLVAVLRRRPNMTHNEYADYIRVTHAKIALANKLTVRKYVQNHVFDSAYGADGDAEYQVCLPRDSVTELYFDDFEAMGRTFADPYTRDVVGPDGANFSDLPSALSMLVTEDRAQAPSGGPDAVKVLHFLSAAEGIPAVHFHERWRQAHEQLVVDRPDLAEHFRGCEWNVSVPASSMTEYFGGAEQPSYSAYLALWFDQDNALPAFRAYERALQECLSGDGLFQLSHSFFLLSREVIIFDDLTANDG